MSSFTFTKYATLSSAAVVIGALRVKTIVSKSRTAHKLLESG